MSFFSDLTAGFTDTPDQSSTEEESNPAEVLAASLTTAIEETTTANQLRLAIDSGVAAFGENTVYIDEQLGIAKSIIEAARGAVMDDGFVVDDLVVQGINPAKTEADAAILREQRGYLAGLAQDRQAALTAIDNALTSGLAEIAIAKAIAAGWRRGLVHGSVVWLEE